MENNIINKISSIIMKEDNNPENKISILKYIELMNYINNQISNKIKSFIKKTNNKLSNNLAFFDYEIKNIEFRENIIININRELKIKSVIISPKKLEVISDFKNKDVFLSIIKDDLKELISYIKQYSYLNDISIKFKDNDLNVIINSNIIELFMNKSPNWITMGKAFSLKYDLQTKKFNYEYDPIGLEKSIKNQEKLLFSKIFFDKSLLPNELLLVNDSYKNSNIVEKKENFLKKLLKRFNNIFKK